MQFSLPKAGTNTSYRQNNFGIKLWPVGGRLAIVQQSFTYSKAKKFMKLVDMIGCKKICIILINFVSALKDKMYKNS